MTLHRGSQRAIIAVFFAVLAVFHAIAWLAPAVGLNHDDAAYLVTAKAIAAGHGYTIDSLPHPVPQIKYPPLFPALLALFVLVSQQAQWLKLLPLLCTAGWLALTYRLLLKMGATKNGSLLLVFLTGASPMVVFLATNLLSETLFALLLTAALLMLLEDRAVLAGALAGLATLTRAAGVPLIIACILTLVIRRRFRSAILFTAVAMVIVAPWFGWSLANGPHDAYAMNILTALPANEKLIVLTRNFLMVLQSPALLLTGLNNLYAVMATILAMALCLYFRRNLLPDLFVGLYCFMLLLVVWPPARFVAPILPLVLWMIWRVVSRMKIQEALAAAVLIIAGAGLWADIVRFPSTLSDGSFSAGMKAPVNWGEMQKLFGYIRTGTPQTSVVLSDADSLLYLNTGRKTVRGFEPDDFGLFYAMREAGVTPDQISKAIVRDQVDYVVVTPERDFAESPSFHAAVRALERGGVLQPVAIPGIAAEYRVLRVQ